MVLPLMPYETHKDSFGHIRPVTCHTDHVGPGTIFVAVEGQATHGVKFIAQAIDKGATHIIAPIETELEPSLVQIMQERGVVLDRVANPRLALAQLSAAAYDYPADKMKIIAVTGTKGKTTTATLMHHLLASVGFNVGLISTVENKIGATVYEASLTTPQPDYLHMFLQRCLQSGVTHVVMEASAQALSLHRLHGIAFDAAVFTNFAHEHLEFYPSLEHYFQAKASLAKYMKPGATFFLNGDDERVSAIEYSHAQKISLHDLQIESVAPIFGNFIYKKRAYRLEVPALMGRFNAYNLLFALHAAAAVGLPMEQLVKAATSFPGVKGRLELYKLPSGATCFIDYAHTPDSYKEVLSLLRTMTKELTVIFGCGGLRDASKRPMMGNIAASLADKVILTADNPRTEDVISIIDAIESGIAIADREKVLRIPDRAQAIAYGCNSATKGGIVALLGKGVDEYQIMGATKSFFSDKQQVERAIQEFSGQFSI